MEELLKGYEIVSCIQDKQEKQIYKIREKASGRLCVLKCASGTASILLKAEAESLKELQEPFLPELIRYEESEDKNYLIRSYVEGLTVWERIETYGPMDSDEAVGYMVKICRILENLHTRMPAVIYRDLKPQNIVLTPDGNCVLIDLGTVRSYKDGAEEDTVFVGTRSTAAPEQFGYRQTDARADIYGAGVVLYYMLTGELKLEKEQLKKLPVRLRRVINKCTCFSPEGRYASAGRLERSLTVCRREQARRIRVRQAHAMAFLLILSAFQLYQSIAGPKPVVFTSSLLEQAVREELGRTDKEPVYEEDLAAVRQIYICGNTVFHKEEDHWQYYQRHSVRGEEVIESGGIKDLSILSHMKNLQKLILDNQNISDLSPLSGLPLEKLSVCNNPVSDLTPLSACQNLQVLRIEDTGTENLSALSGLRQLKTLDAGFTNVTSVMTLEDLQLSELRLIGIHVDDFEGIAHMPLRRLCLYGISQDAVRLIGTLTTLQELTIYNSGIEDFSDLANLHDLENLDLHSNSITSLDGLDNFPKLIRLCVGNNPVQNIDGVKACSLLEKLELGDTPVNNFAAIKELKHLTYMTVSEEHQPELLASVPTPWFVYADE